MAKEKEGWWWGKIAKASYPHIHREKIGSLPKYPQNGQKAAPIID
jgi:hypothetical protein